MNDVIVSRDKGSDISDKPDLEFVRMAFSHRKTRSVIKQKVKSEYFDLWEVITCLSSFSLVSVTFIIEETGDSSHTEHLRH